MLKHRKYQVLFITLLMLFSLSGCASAIKQQHRILNAGNSGVVDGLYYDYEEKSDIYVFRTGNTYLLNRVGNTGWVETYNGAPSGLSLTDGEFAFLNADLTLISGGVAGYMSAPSVSVIHSQKNASLSDVENSGSLSVYDPTESYIYGLKIFTDGNDTYLIAREKYNQFRLYKNGAFYDSFSTKYEVDAALGIRTKADPTADMEQFGKLNVYVMRCGDKYLIYTGNISFNVQGIWREFLNEEFGNTPLDFSLTDGQVVCLKDAELMKVEGGNGGYSHTPMLIRYQSMEDLRIDTLTLKTSPGHWEDGAAKNDLESKQYGAGDSFIILIDGRYYVYKTVNGNNVSLGIFDSEAEVDAVL